MVYSLAGNNFTRRKKLTINNNSGGALTEFQVQVTVTYTSVMQADFDDVRFGNKSGTSISYWLESKTDSTTATFWIKCDLPNYGAAPTGDNIFYMYYGNGGLTSASNGNNTFLFFDDFEDGDYTGKFQTTQGTLTEANGYIQYLAVNGRYSSATAVYSVGTSDSWKARALLQKTDNGARDVLFGQVGTENAGDTMNAHIVMVTGIHYSAPGYLGLYTYDTGVNDILISNNIPVVDVYTNPQIWQLSKQTDNVTAKVFNASGTELGTVTTTTQVPDSTKGIGIYGANPSGQYLKLYWFFIGKSIATEPTYLFGSEEHRKGVIIIYG